MWPAKIWGLHSFDAGRDWGQEEKGMTEDEIAGWHHWLDGCESEWTPGVGDGQGGLACWDSWGHKESDMTERLNWTELNWFFWETNEFIRLQHCSFDSVSYVWKLGTCVLKKISSMCLWYTTPVFNNYLEKKAHLCLLSRPLCLYTYW